MEREEPIKDLVAARNRLRELKQETLDYADWRLRHHWYTECQAHIAYVEEVAWKDVYQ